MDELYLVHIRALVTLY